MSTRSDVVDTTPPTEPSADDPSDPAPQEPDPSPDGDRGLLHRGRRLVAESLFPDAAGRPGRWWALLALYVVWTTVFLFRVPWPWTFQRVWAEDGAVFLQDQAQRGFWGSLFRPYNGYMHGVPRIATALVAQLPVTQQAAGLALVNAAVVGGAAVLVHIVLRDLTGRPWIGMLAASYLVAVPVGYETLGNIANLQWRLLPAAALLALWTPRTRWGAVIASVVLIATATTSPFALVALVVLVVRLVVRPTRTAVAFTASAAVGTAALVIVAVQAPERPLKPVPGVHQLVDQYALRVVANGLIGENGLLGVGLPLATRVGQALLLLVLGLLVVAAVRGGPRIAIRTAGVGLIGIATYLAPMVLSAPDYADGGAQRYYVAPAVLLAVTLLSTLGTRTAPDAPPTPQEAPRERRSWRERSGQVPATVALVVVMVGVGLANLELPFTGGLATPIRWDTALERARADCAADPSSRDVEVQVNPTVTDIEWVARLTCAQVR